jgi:hypothetical protein
MKRGRKPELRFCKIEGCNRPLEARGLCTGHYRRLRRYGDPKASEPIRRWGLIVFGIFWLGLAQVTLATPFLVSDPYPAGQDLSVTPVNFVLVGLAAQPINSPALVNADGSVQLSYDLSALVKGNYTVTATAVNNTGGSSPASAPFSFTSGAPASPQNLRIVP